MVVFQLSDKPKFELIDYSEVGITKIKPTFGTGCVSGFPLGNRRAPG